MYKDLYDGFIPISYRLKTTHISVHRRVDEETVIYSYPVILLRKEQTPDTRNCMHPKALC